MLESGSQQKSLEGSSSPLFPPCLLLSPTISLNCLIKVKLTVTLPAWRGEAWGSVEGGIRKVTFQLESGKGLQHTHEKLGLSSISRIVKASAWVAEAGRSL